MKYFSLHNPCADCPFRSDIGFFLNKEKRESIARDLLDNDKTFPCHSTVDYDQWSRDGEYKPNYKKEKQCAGALIVLKKSDHLYDNWVFRFAAIRGWFEPDKLNMNTPVFDTMDEFVSEEDEG